MKNVMTKAWEIAKEGQKKFGGKVKEYFAQALRMAWAIIKKGGNAMKGSEKQVKWAEDIKSYIFSELDEVSKDAAKGNGIQNQKAVRIVEIIKEKLDQVEHAKTFIDVRWITKDKSAHVSKAVKEIVDFKEIDQQIAAEFK